MQISILGTGAIGAAMAEALIKAGHQVTVYNRTPTKLTPLVALGARVAATPAEAIGASQASIIALPDAEALRNVLLQGTDQVLAGARVLNLSSTRPEEIAEIGLSVAVKGGSLAEVTVNVGPDQVRAGQGVYMLGCADQDETFWTEVLKSAGGTTLRAGQLGDASKAEIPLMLSYLFGMVASAYIAAAAKAYGTRAEVLESFVYPSLPMAQYLVPHMQAGVFADASASVDAFAALAEKSTESLDGLGLSVNVMHAVTGVFKAASALGHGSKDGAALIEALHARAA